MKSSMIALTGVCAGVVIAILGMIVVAELRNGPRLMPASIVAAYEKWCGEDKGGQTHYDAQKHITGCTVPAKR